jgi:hypothetical protein
LRVPRSAWAPLGLGLALLVAGRLAAPSLPAPLFDGLVVEAPYRYLTPPPGAPGNPPSATDTEAVTGGVAPSLFVATNETPPQAQLITDRDAFNLAADASSIKGTIDPVPPPALPSVGVILGNVYRIGVTDQAGSPLTLREGVTMTVVLRAPVALAGAEIFSFTGSSWNRLETQNGGMPDIYAANVNATGDFAVIGPSSAASLLAGQSPQPVVPVNQPPSAGIDATPFIVLGIALGIAVLAALELWQRRQRHLAAHAPQRRRASPPPDDRERRKR